MLCWRPKVKSHRLITLITARFMIDQHLRRWIQERSRVHDFRSWVRCRSWCFVGLQIQWQSSSFYVVQASQKIVAKFNIDPYSASLWFHHNHFLPPSKKPLFFSSHRDTLAQQSDFASLNFNPPWKLLLLRFSPLWFDGLKLYITSPLSSWIKVPSPVFSDFHPTPDLPDLPPWLFGASLCLQTLQHLHPDFVTILKKFDIWWSNLNRWK